MIKIVMYEYWYDYGKPKYGESTKLLDLADDVEKRFDMLNYKNESAITIGKNKKVIRLIKDESRGKIMSSKMMTMFIRNLKREQKSM